MKSFVRSFIFLIVSMSLLGCIGRPGPMVYELWKKRGATHADVRKALLECGANNPFHDPEIASYSEGTIYSHEWAKVELCMTYSGFNLNWLSSTYCDRDRKKNEIPACQTGNENLIPKRSAEVRLNSKFCKDPWYSRSPACDP